MQALVLAGGEGTRLRPLTLTVPKPVMPLAGRPFLSFMLDWLGGHGVGDVMLACGFLGDAVERVLGTSYRGMRLRYIHEDEPLDTAGPVALAASLDLLEDRVVVLNGDVLADFDLSAQLSLHERTGAVATLALVAVSDATGYGVVPTNPAGEVEAFLEKSEGTQPTNRINAGAYVLERAAIELIPPGRAASFEREVFPALVGRGLHGYLAEGYWIDIGTPERYLEATYALLEGRASSTLPPRDQTCSLVDATSSTDGSRVGPLSVLGADCSVGRGSVIERAVVHDQSRVGADCLVTRSVLAAGVTVEDRARVGPGAVVGPGARVGAGVSVEPGARIQPGDRV